MGPGAKKKQKWGPESRGVFRTLNNFERQGEGLPPPKKKKKSVIGPNFLFLGPLPVRPLRKQFFSPPKEQGPNSEFLSNWAGAPPPLVRQGALVGGGVFGFKKKPPPWGKTRNLNFWAFQAGPPSRKNRPPTRPPADCGKDPKVYRSGPLLEKTALFPRPKSPARKGKKIFGTTFASNFFFFVFPCPFPREHAGPPARIQILTKIKQIRVGVALFYPGETTKPPYRPLGPPEQPPSSPKGPETLGGGIVGKTQPQTPFLFWPLGLTFSFFQNRVSVPGPPFCLPPQMARGRLPRKE